ncbi:MAG: hypothetical protein KBF73_09260 [Flavobacteriales bacterium]|nr:hypothetical protein [Flavobacteriales bacterium]
MINAILRLEFAHVFPDEEPLELFKYLGNVSDDTLLNVIGFTNTSPQPNFNNFHTNLKRRQEVTDRVIDYCKRNQITKKPQLISREGALRLAEVILSNRETLLKKEGVFNPDNDEENLFKSFLIVNKEINGKQKQIQAGEGIDYIADLIIGMAFSVSDLGLDSNNNREFLKLLYVTIVRFELLIEFLEAENREYLLNDLVAYYNQDSVAELSRRVKTLLAHLLGLKSKNGYKLIVDSPYDAEFLDSLVSVQIYEDEDFTQLKNSPLYKIDERTYSIIDYFFVLDKFTKSTKFILKESFNRHNNLKSRDRTFFQFFNTEYSERYLSKSILNQVFHDRYFIKKPSVNEKEYEPDYYVRQGNRVYLFEIKDVLIAKDVKSSGDADTIYRTLSGKFFENDGKPIGIGQLVTSIVHIVEGKFEFDKYISDKKNLTIYPVLLVTDRIFEIHGINYKLNQWYLDSVKSKLGKRYNPNFIKDLTLIDIDTLIYWLPYLEGGNNVFRDVLNEHLRKMSGQIKKFSRHTQEEIQNEFNKRVSDKIAPISSRLPDYRIPLALITDRFQSVFAQENSKT